MNKFLRILCLASVFLGVWTISAQTEPTPTPTCDKKRETTYHRFLKIDNWPIDKTTKEPFIKCEGEIISFFRIPGNTILRSKPALTKSEQGYARFVGQFWATIDGTEETPDDTAKNEKGELIAGAYMLETKNGTIPAVTADPAKALCPAPDKLTKDSVNPYSNEDSRFPKYNKEACIESLNLLKKVCKYDLDCNQIAKADIQDEQAKETASENKKVQDAQTAYDNAKLQAEKKLQDDILFEIRSVLQRSALGLDWNSVKTGTNAKLSKWSTSGQPFSKKLLESGKTSLSSLVSSEAAKDEPVSNALTALNDAKTAAGETTTATSDENKKTLEEKVKTAKEITKRILFIDNRISELNMSILVEDSSTFNVTSVLRMNEDSKESQLKIIGGDSNRNIFDKIIRLVAQTLGTFGVLLLIVASFYMITSQGDENQLQKGKQIFIYTALGLLVAFLSYTIVQLVLDLLLW